MRRRDFLKRTAGAAAAVAAFPFATEQVAKIDGMTVDGSRLTGNSPGAILIETERSESPEDSEDIQLVEVGGGTFTISFQGKSTEDIAWDATPAEVEAAINSLSNVFVVHVQVKS